MKLGIVGSRTLAGDEKVRALIEGLLRQHKPELLVTGTKPKDDPRQDCVDGMAARAAKQMKIPVDIKEPKNRKWTPDGFRERNIEIVEAVGTLICIRDPDSKTYGAGWTLDYARKAGKKTLEILVSPGPSELGPAFLT